MDPVALLTREHRVILEQLQLIEVTLASPTSGPRGGLADRCTLRELFRFFTTRVGIHFEREMVLIASLAAALGGKRGRSPAFDSVTQEHAALVADAKRLTGRLDAGNANGRLDVRGIQAFVRRYRLHLDWEERILFVLARARLTAEEKTRVGSRMLEV